MEVDTGVVSLTHHEKRLRSFSVSGHFAGAFRVSDAHRILPSLSLFPLPRLGEFHGQTLGVLTVVVDQL